MLPNITAHAILTTVRVTMPTLHIENISNELFLQIQRLAKAHGRSLNAQVIVLLAQALKHEKEKELTVQLKVLASIRQRRFMDPQDSPSSLALLHEDRDRWLMLNL